MFITQRNYPNGRTLFYLARAFRKNGTPTHEIVQCLGSAEDIKNAYSGNKTPNNSEQPDGCRIYEYGAVAALLHLAERLKIAEIIDKYAPKRKQGLSIGNYMVLAAINRAVEPVSKNTFFEWFNETVLIRSFTKANKNTLSGQSFWNHMVELDQDIITQIGNEITENIVKMYNISVNCLLFDNTNFITYINTSNTAKIPQRGHSKEKRADLKIIGLSLMVSSDHNVPLFHETYPGNKHDSSQIIEIMDKLKQRISKIANNNSIYYITFVFDKGNNSDGLIELLEDGSHEKIHFVGGLRLNQCPELLKVKKEQFISLIGDNFDGTSAYRSEKKIYGHTFTTIITDNEKLRKEQVEGLDANILKCEKELKNLQANLKKREEGIIVKGRKPTCLSVTQNVKNILSAEHMIKVYTYKISTDEKNNIILTYELDKNKYNDLIENYLGKSILFTNRDNWTNEQIVSTYRSQYHVEENFKQLKNINFLSFRPVRHFTDKTIRVHAFYCVLALTLCSLLKLEMEKLGHTMSINAILKSLSKARQSLPIFLKSGTKNKPKFTSAISDAPKEAVDYIEKYDLKKYLII
jgi:transposase